MANGKFGGGDGSKDNPFLIEDAFDLDNVRNGLDNHYKLIKDIDLNIIPFNEGQGWKPIGVDDIDGKRYVGIFEGNSKIIKNLMINTTKDHCGLFGCTKDATIKNLKIENCNINSDGLFIGSIIGELRNNTNLKNCVSYGNITGNNTVGGMIGYAYNSNIKNCKSNCSVTGRDTVGGFSGRSNNSIFTNCYSYGNINPKTDNKIGGFIGENEGTTLNCYWDKSVCNINIFDGLEKSTKEFKTASTFIDWDKEKLEDGKNIWVLKNGEYPKLWFEKLSKFLLKQNNQYHTIKSNFYNVSTNKYLPCEKDYEANGIENLNGLTNEINFIDIKGEKKDKGNKLTVFDFDLSNNISKMEVL